MIISVWRYSHLMLAVSSLIFLVSAAVSGMILAFDPISRELRGYGTADLTRVNVGKTIQVLQATYDEIFTITVNDQNAVSVSVMTSDGEMQEFYIDPVTGAKIGEIQKESPVFQFARTFHRSLFLKGAGRFFVGLSSFLLFLISTTGMILVLKRQQGLRRFFSRIVKENFFQYAHVYSGRLFLIPIIIITLTGVYLSLYRFQVIPQVQLSHQVDLNAVSDVPQRNVTGFPAFKEIPLSEVRSVDFPFSPDVTDYYQLSLKDKEILVNQYTGDILSEIRYPFSEIAFRLSMNLHTGQGSLVWSVILFLAALSILFFIWSGLKITFKRKRSKIKNRYRRDECTYVILVGSETGSTIAFAMQLHKQLLSMGETCYLTELNRYTRFKKMEHLVVVTSTYGQGTAPANASKFAGLFSQNKPAKAYTYAVAGFGSLAYPDFCRFALEVDQLLQTDPNGTRLLEPCTIHNRSWESYRQWVRQWGDRVGLALDLPAKNPEVMTKRKKQRFQIVDKTKAADSPDNTFLVRLQGLQKQTCQSGDLLAIYPGTDEHERLYSIAVAEGNQILLSIKKHKKGLCSNYLDELLPGSTLEAGIVRNPGFHFPSGAKRVVLISTGTGIMPFLGMLSKNHRRVETHLYWGTRNEQSFEHYRSCIERCITNNWLARFVPAYSRTAEGKTYVQDLVDKDCRFMAQTLREEGIIMICGSVAMQKEVISRLERISRNMNGKPLSYYENRRQLRMDCY